MSHSSAHRVIDTVGPLLVLAPGRQRRVDQITIVDGTLIPTRDHRLAAPSKNYRYSTNLQVAIDAHTRLASPLGDPQPGNRNDTIVYRTSEHRPEGDDFGRSCNDGLMSPWNRLRRARPLSAARDVRG